MSELVVGPNTQVTLHFKLGIVGGELVDSTFDKTPATFTVGDGSLLNGFEQKLYGMKSGESASYVVLPEEGFGQPNPNNVQYFKRSDFAADLELAEGLVISFADASQSELPGVVQSFDAEQVVVDFNHPLAGREIQFEVEILAVASADHEG